MSHLSGRAFVGTQEAPEVRQAYARLHYLDESGMEQQVAITGSGFTLGRSHNNNLYLHGRNCSRRHAEIRVENREYTIRDLVSKHGTCINGARVDEAKLRHGDRIQLGGSDGQTVTFCQGDLLQDILGPTSLAGDSLPIRDFKEMGLLISTLHRLSTLSVLNDLMNLVVDAAIKITGAERGFIILRDETQQLKLRCARDAQRRALDDSYIESSVRIPEEVIRTGKPLIINNLADLPDQAAHSSTGRIGIQSIACVPLRCVAVRESMIWSSGGFTDIIGVLCVDSRRPAAWRAEPQISALETLAKEAATAIYNARLYKESQEKKRLDEQLRFARGIQQALLPAPVKTLPYASACSLNLPCYQIGGDYFDYFDLAGGRLGFAIGDVSGKGVPAALMAAKIHGIFSTLTTFDLPLPLMIANANSNLVGRPIESTFVTLFFGVLDPQGNCTYTNAGHNPPVLVRRDGSLHEMTKGGLVLGAFADMDYESETLKLDPGDHVVLFTDGVLDAENVAGEDFGKDRLEALIRECAALPASETLARLHGELNSFCAGAPHRDDITIMVLGFNEAMQAF